MKNAVEVHGPAAPHVPLVLDSPHSGFVFPADMRAAVSEFDLRDGEDCFIDELYRPATERGVALIAAQFPRTYIDPNRHPGDIDLDLLEGGHWPYDHVPSGKAELGKALIWRTLDDGRAIYARRLSVVETEARIAHYHAPYQSTLQQWIAATHQRFGASFHINCHSMNAVAGTQGEGGAGSERADFVLGDRDGTTCAPAFTAFVRETLAGMGYHVKVNDPYKGVELVRAFSNPALGRHSLQLEINKRLYMNEATRSKHDGFEAQQKNLLVLVDAVLGFAAREAKRG
ncbi:MAG: N-formylglutamate amidohydrolase [Burkholderiales bacterium]|nr:N-formylglutamate amidohydrolase [Burkholderiales bacterium]